MRTQNGGIRLPVLPCLCMGLAMLLFAITLLNSNLPVMDSHRDGHAVSFVSAQGSQHRVPQTLMQARKKFSIADRGTPEYKAYMEEEGRKKTEDWERFTTKDGLGGEKEAGNFGFGTSIADEETWKNGGLGDGAPKPSPAPAPARAPAPANPGGSSDSGGNPFQFIIDIFNPTTTTTTTTPPPDPITAFFNSLR